MFHAIEKFRTPAQILLGLIAVSFVGFGVAGFELSSNDNYIVKVGDEVITQQQLDEAMRNTQAAGGSSTRQAVFQTLLDQAYLLEGAKKLGIFVSDEQIKQSIVDNPQFHDANKKFDPALFQNFIQHNYGNEAAFMEQERRRLTLMSLFNSLAQSTAADSQAAMLINAQLAPRQARSVAIVPDAFADKVVADDAALQKYYDAHKADFVLPQAVKYEYVVLSPKLLADKETASDEEIKKAFDAQQQGATAKRHLAHILFNAPKSADEATRTKAKAEAEKVLAELKAQPDQFAALAKQYSQDSGSKDKGGDLGEFSQNGALGSKSLEDAAFALKEGEISGVVESDFGYHIVRASQIGGGDLASQKDALAAEIKQKKAQTAYNTLRENFSDAVFADSGSLKTAADKFGLTVQTQNEWQSKTDLAAKTEDTTAVPQAVIDTLFSDEMLTKKHNSEGINVNGETWFVRATEVRPETTQALSEVKDKVKQAFIQAESVRLAKEQGEKWLADLRAGKTVNAAWSPVQTAMPQQLRNALPAEAFTQFMQAIPRDGKSAFVLLPTEPAPQLVEVVKIESLSDQPELVQQARQIAAQSNGNNLMEAYLQSLQTQIKTKQGSQTVEAQ
ncbi:SurA N-terminal domain-containing protein [Neisseriaceae bacterium B1]